MPDEMPSGEPHAERAERAEGAEHSAGPAHEEVAADARVGAADGVPPAERPRGAGATASLAVAAGVAIALAAAFGMRLDPGATAPPLGRTPVAAGDAAGAGSAGDANGPDDGAVGSDLALGRAVAALRVRDEAGAVVPLRPAGEPAVVMVSSVTCGYCDRSMRDLAAMAGGRALPRLRVVTLEGAREGAAMLRRTGVTGAFSGGPAGSAEQVLLTFRIPGTPVFAVLDSAGRVTRVVPGYPGREGLRGMFEVMVAEKD